MRDRSSVDAVVFDLGGVLIDWDPRRLYRALFDGDEDKVTWFLDSICTAEWNDRQDAGRSLAEATAERTRLFPDWREAIAAYYGRWIEMIVGRVPGTSAILERLKAQGTRVFALSNWSAETFPRVRDDYPELRLFERTFLSGEHRVTKPDPRFFQIALSAIELPASRIAFIDDKPVNVLAAQKLGMHGLHFTGAAALEVELSRLGVLR